MSDMLTELLIECSEGLDLIDRHLVTLELDPANEDLLTEIFRALHTIKGSCGFHGLDRLEQVAHSAENLLTLLRAGDLLFDRPIADALLSTVDTFRSILATVQQTGEEGDADVSSLTAHLDALAAGSGSAGEPETTGTDHGATEAVSADSYKRRRDDEVSSEQLDAGHVDPDQVEPWPELDDNGDGDTDVSPYDADVEGEGGSSNADAEPDAGEDAAEPPAAPADSGPAPNPTPAAPGAPRIGDLLVSSGTVDRATVEKAAAEQGLGDTRPIGDILIEQGGASAEAIEGAAAAQARVPNAIDSTIRVDVGLLDELVNLVGELVLSRNELIRLATDYDDPVFVPPSQRLDLITSELQERVMKTRMQPINSAWAKLPRIVRDLSQQLDKEVSVVMSGQETELDRTIIEAIRDPLTHIVRNIVDHGIEDPETREALGKPRRGTLALAAGHEGEQVNITISDDGRGIDPAHILATAVERGVVGAKEGAEMTDAEIIALVFRPGFSTATSVTNVSGRGVGMDVVKSNIERIGGSVDLRTEIGRGTTFAIKIPLTLAIIPALTVRGDEGRYAIPQVNVLELVRFRDGGPDRIEDIHGAPVYRLRGRLLPIVDLREQLGLAPIEQTTTHIAVVKTDTLRFGLVVDGIDDNGEIVVKPLGHHLKDLKLFSGATILGDGTVALILDLVGLAERAGLLVSGTGFEQESGDTDSHVHRSLGAEAMIVLSVGGGERVAVNLDEIDRLEEISVETVERSDGRPVVQYRGALMPLIDLGQVIGLGGSVLTEHSRINVVVCLSGGRTVGLAVEEILDIVHSDAVQPTGQPGTIIVDAQVTDMISPETVIAAALPGLHRVDDFSGLAAEPGPDIAALSSI